jgi:hypothetical protein
MVGRVSVAVEAEPLERGASPSKAKACGRMPIS